MVSFSKELALMAYIQWLVYIHIYVPMYIHTYLHTYVHSMYGIGRYQEAKDESSHPLTALMTCTSNSRRARCHSPPSYSSSAQLWPIQGLTAVMQGVCVTPADMQLVVLRRLLIFCLVSSSISAPDWPQLDETTSFASNGATIRPGAKDAT